MKNKKLLLILLFVAITSLKQYCFCQIGQYDVSGAWIATKGELITSFLNGDTEISKADIRELKISFSYRTLKLNRTFNSYSPDSIYNYAFMDTIPMNRRYRNNIRIKFYDKKSMVLEMHFLGRHRLDRDMWYDIYLKRE